MHYTDLMLKFASEEEAKANLYDKVAIAWDNSDPEAEPVATEWEHRPKFRNIDTLGVIYTGGNIHLHHTKDARELIRMNGSELASTVHNCDFIDFSFDPRVRCTRFLSADGGTAEVVAYREIR